MNLHRIARRIAKRVAMNPDPMGRELKFEFHVDDRMYQGKADVVSADPDMGIPAKIEIIGLFGPDGEEIIDINKFMSQHVDVVDEAIADVMEKQTQHENQGVWDYPPDPTPSNPMVPHTDSYFYKDPVV